MTSRRGNNVAASGRARLGNLARAQARRDFRGAPACGSRRAVRGSRAAPEPENGLALITPSCTII